MRKRFDLQGDFDFYTGEIIDNILLLNLKDKIMFRATNLKAKSVILDYLDQVSRTDTIKVALIVNSPKKSGREEYFEFFNQVINAGGDFNAVYKLLDRSGIRNLEGRAGLQAPRRPDNNVY